MPTFILSTNDVNSYGFRVLTEGIELPVSGKLVMLWNHVRANGTDKNQILPIGHWVNLRKEGGKLLADPEFDMDDPFAADIARKVEAGHIFEASAGLKPRKWDPSSMVAGQTLATLAASKIREASICDVASNDGAIALYDDNDQVIDLGDKTALVSLTAGNTSTPTIHNMEELKIIGGLLGLTGNITLSDVQTKITALVALSSENTALKAKLKEIEDAQKAQRDNDIKTLVDAAVAENRITQAQRQVYVNLFNADFDSAKAALEGLPKVVKLSDFPAGKNGNGSGDFTYNGKTFSEMRKGDPAGLQKLKDNDFDTFNMLYKAEFGKDYKVDAKD